MSKLKIYFFLSQNNEQKTHIQCLFAGAYVPLTMEVNIIVGGVLASCYASSHHDLVHIATVPVLWFPEAIDWIFGDDKKFLAYVNILNDLGNFVLSNEMLHV